MAMVPVRVMVGVRTNAYKTLLLNRNQPQSWTARTICSAMAKKMAVSNGGSRQTNVDYRTYVLSYNTSPLGMERQQPTDANADADAEGAASATARKSKTWTRPRSKSKGRGSVVLPAEYQRIEPGESVLELEHHGRRVRVLGLPAGAGTSDRSEEDVAVQLVFHEDPDAAPSSTSPPAGFQKSAVQSQAQGDKHLQQPRQQQKSTPLMERLKRLSPRVTRKQVGQIRRRYFPGPSRAGRR